MGGEAMADEIKLPELGENLEGGEVLDVRVAVGDTVTAGQTLIEVDAEKSTVEVPAPQAGRISKILVKKGDLIKVGQSICFLDSGAGAKSSDSKADEATKAEDGKAAPKTAE